MKLYTHGQLFKDKNNNILSIEGSQKNKKEILANYIYLVDEEIGWVNIQGTPYLKVIKKQNGEWRNFKEQEIILQKKLGNYKNSAIYPFNQLIKKSEIHNLTNTKDTLKKFMVEKNKESIILSAFQVMNITIEEYSSIGMIGSFQVGQYSKTSDIDLIFYLSKERNFEIFTQIQEIIKNNNGLFGKGERARLNPLRFKHKEHEFCIHFSLPEDLIEKFEIKEDAIGSEIEKIFEVASIDYSIYCPTILKCKNDEFLILYHGGDRGIFSVGDKLKVKGTKYEVGVVINSYERYLG